jgi:hypothetical protein
MSQLLLPLPLHYITLPYYLHYTNLLTNTTLFYCYLLLLSILIFNQWNCAISLAAADAPAAAVAAVAVAITVAALVVAALTAVASIVVVAAATVAFAVTIATAPLLRGVEQVRLIRGDH